MVDRVRVELSVISIRATTFSMQNKIRAVKLALGNTKRNKTVETKRGRERERERDDKRQQDKIIQCKRRHGKTGKDKARQDNKKRYNATTNDNAKTSQNKTTQDKEGI